MTNNNNQGNEKNNVAENIKDGAGAAFHATHDALEATENTAMNAVDQTAKAVNKVTNNKDRNNQKK